MRSCCRLACAAAVSLLSAAANLHACNVPVFRYALENWRADAYQVYILHEGELTAEQKQLVEKLTAASIDRQPPANMIVHELDVTTLSDEASADAEASSEGRTNGQPSFFRQWVDQVSPSTPWIVALYPPQMHHGIPAWSGDLNEANVECLVDSQVRQEIARRILSGQSAVWVLIESGNAEKDNKAFQQLEQWLVDIPEQVSLPDRSLIESDEQFRGDNPIELKVEFSVLRVRRDDPQELASVSMLLGSEDDLRDFDEPIAIPVYGRGRTYFALVGRGINQENVRDNCQFICGACSCQVKQENPGVDLLLAMNWEDQILGSAMPDKPMPVLTGVGIFEVDTEESATVAPEAEPTESETSDATSVAMNPEPPADNSAPLDVIEATVQSEPAEPAAFEGRLLIGVGGLLVVGLVVLGGLTVLLRRHSSAG